MHRSLRHSGVSTRGPAAEVARANAAKTGNLERGTPAARVSPLAGPYETNVGAKSWRIIAPDGDQYACTNLRLWCETNAALFDPDDWRKAYGGFRAVAASLAGTRGKARPVRQWKGWTLAGAPTPQSQKSPAAGLTDDGAMNW